MIRTELEAAARSTAAGWMRAMIGSAAMLGLAACAPADDVGLESDVGSKGDEIVGGSAFTDVPAIGALAYGSSPFCTGTLISPTRVVTAAHCVEGTSASSITFITGPSARSIQTRTRVVRAVPHPDYDDRALVNDIAYLDLASQPTGVTPIGVLPEGAMTSAWVGRELLHVGYGVTNGSSQTGGGTKRAVLIPITRVSATQFRYGATGRNTCNGDSGGPALYRDSSGNYLVAGITSYGDATCTSYGVDTRPDAYLDFLGVSGGAEPDPGPTPDPGGTPSAETIRQSGSLAAGRAYFLDAVPVRAGTPFRASTTGTGDADLYVQFGARPTSRTYACRPYAGDANEVCDLTVPAGVTEAYVAVNGYTATDFTLTVTHTP